MESRRRVRLRRPINWIWKHTERMQVANGRSECENELEFSSRIIRRTAAAAAAAAAPQSLLLLPKRQINKRDVWLCRSDHYICWRFFWNRCCFARIRGKITEYFVIAHYCRRRCRGDRRYSPFDLSFVYWLRFSVMNVDCIFSIRLHLPEYQNLGDFWRASQ